MPFLVFPIEFASSEYDAYIALRDKLLRHPLDLSFSEQELSDEYLMYHFGVYENEKIVGCFVLKKLKSDLIKMRQVAVDDEYQNNGLGTLMVQYCEAWCKMNGFKKIELNARIPAVKFYTKNNYNTVGDQFMEIGIPHQKMEKKLV